LPSEQFYVTGEYEAISREEGNVFEIDIFVNFGSTNTKVAAIDFDGGEPKLV
jgi:hypothetical protein